MTLDPARFLRSMFDAAVAAASPALCVPSYLPEPPAGRTVVVGAGKAAAAMARVVEDHWRGPLGGLVVTRYGHGAITNRIEVVEAGHPLPDAAGLKAAQRIMALAEDLGPDDLLLALISGGGSALLTLPALGVPPADKRAINKALLLSGATIAEINCVRKHLSAIKGGRLALAAYPARVVSLIISDVPGDDPATVASGPTVPDPTSLADAREILAKYGLLPPGSVAARLADPAAETPKPGDPRLARTDNLIVATAKGSLAAAGKFSADAGVTPIVLGDDIEGEARQVAAEHARMAVALAAKAGTPQVLSSGGETSVTVRGGGRGGRNAEYLLALAIALDGHPQIHAIACDTDGIDGTEDNAGALLAPDSLGRATALGLDAAAMLDDNDGYGFFSGLGDLIVTGPTRTNVNDFRAILVLPT